LSYLTTPTLTPAGVVEIGLQINLIYQSSKAPNQEGQLKGWHDHDQCHPVWLRAESTCYSYPEPECWKKL